MEENKLTSTDVEKPSPFDQVPYPYSFHPGHPKKILRVPLCRQARDYTCGVSSLQSILGYWGDEWREDTLAKKIGADPEHGADQKKMVEFVKGLGYEASNEFGYTIEQLKQRIDEGTPVIVLYQAWTGEDPKSVEWEKRMGDGHYSVVVGYCDENLYFMDPSILGMYGFLPIEEFERRWHNEDPPGNLEDHNAIPIRKPEPAWYDHAKFAHID